MMWTNWMLLGMGISSVRYNFDGEICFFLLDSTFLFLLFDCVCSSG